MSEKGFLEDAYADRDTKQTREFYDRWAEVYDQELDQNAYQQPERCATALFSILPEANARLLDIGCGTGLSGLALVEQGYRTIDGCDLSPGMLEKAGKLGLYHDLFECDLNVPPLPREANSYDGITAVGIFSFGHVQPSALEEICRLAKPGAPIIIGLNNHYYEDGSLTTKIDAMAEAGQLKKIDEEFGDHLPGIGLTGWVISLHNLTG